MIPTFKIRGSAGGKIVGGINKPTEKQLAELARLEAKQADNTITDKQCITLNDLIAKRDAKPNLGEGAKTYCQDWIKENIIFGIRREFSNKYTEKGILCEPEGIDLVSDIMGYGMVSKNEQHFEDDFMTGTPDLILSDTVEDIKCSWSPFTFPLFATEIPDSDYYYQLQIYMALTGKKKAALNYCLIDAPSEMIDTEARRQAFKLGMSDVEMELYDEVAAKMTYTHIPKRLKLKRFEFDRDDNVIETIRGQVKLCREYIDSLLQQRITVYDQIGDTFLTIIDKIEKL